MLIVTFVQHVSDILNMTLKEKAATAAQGVNGAAGWACGGSTWWADGGGRPLLLLLLLGH